MFYLSGVLFTSLSFPLLCYPFLLFLLLLSPRSLAPPPLTPLAPRKPPPNPGINSRRIPNPPLETNKEAKHQQSAVDTSPVEGLVGTLARMGVPAPGRACLFVISGRRIGALWDRQHEQVRAGTHPNKARAHRGPTNPPGKGRDVRGTVRRPSGS